MHRSARWIAGALLVGAAGAAAVPRCADLAQPQYLMRIESFLVDPKGVHPMEGPGWDPIPIGLGGIWYGTVALGIKDTAFDYEVHYRPTKEGKIRLRVERTFRRGAARDPLPVIEHVMDAIDSWRTTILEETGLGGKLDLRVVPMMRALAADVPFTEGRVGMRFEGAPLLYVGKREQDCKVMFQEMNALGVRGLDLGLPGFGVVKLHLTPFPGAVPCGRVLGHTLSFHFGDNEFVAWSIHELLPDDLDRPGEGWTVYGTFEPNPSLSWADSYYGAFVLESEKKQRTQRP